MVTLKSVLIKIPEPKLKVPFPVCKEFMDIDNPGIQKFPYFYTGNPQLSRGSWIGSSKSFCRRIYGRLICKKRSDFHALASYDAVLEEDSRNVRGLAN